MSDLVVSWGISDRFGYLYPLDFLITPPYFIDGARFCWFLAGHCGAGESTVCAAH